MGEHLEKQERRKVRTTTREKWLARIEAEPWVPGQTYIAIDWGETETAYAVITADGLVGAQGKVPNNLAGLNTLRGLASAWANPTTGKQPPFVIEPTRRPLTEALLANGHTLLVVKGNALASRRAHQGSRVAKSDIRDAIEIGEIARTQPHDTHRAVPADAGALAVASLVRDRKQAVKNVNKTANRLRSITAEYHPVFLEAFSTSDLSSSKAAWAFLRAAPTHGDMVALTRDECEEIVRAVTKGRYRETAERVHRTFQQAPVPLLHPTAMDKVFAKHALRLVDVIEQQRKVVDDLDAQIAEAVDAHPVTPLFRHAKGLGPATMAALVATAVARRDEFGGRRGFLAWSGQVPTVIQSGGSERHPRRDNLKTEIAQACWMWSTAVQLHQPVAKHLYWQLRAKGNGHPTATRKIAARLLNALWHCLNTAEIWDDNVVWATTLTAEQLATETERNRQIAKNRRSAAVAAKYDKPRKRTLDGLRDEDLGSVAKPVLQVVPNEPEVQLEAG